MGRFRALVMTNRTTPRRYEIRQEADEATVYLYDLIDPYWGVGAAQFVKDLSTISASTIHLRINSPGGDVFDGRAMATALREHKARVVAHIDGLAASAATYAVMAADEVEIAQGAMVMIHRAASLTWGNAEDMRKLADVLDKIDDSLVAEYVRETGQDEETIRAWYDAETWFTAEEAVEHGFADRLSEGTGAVENAWDLSAFGRPTLQPAPKNESTDDDGAHDERARRLRLVEISA